MTLASPTELQTTIENAIRSAKSKAVAEVKGLGYFAKGTDTADAITEGASKLFLTTDERSKIADIESLLSAAVAKAKLDAHPVGSYYWSSEATDPGTLFGGTWEQIKDRFIYAAGSKGVGETGGAESHVLTVDEIPAHNHTGTTSWHSFDGYFSAEAYQGGHRDGGGVVSSEGHYSTNVAHGSDDDWGTNYHINVGHNHTFTTNNTGGNAAHSNMPPYLVAYCWKRTA